MEERSHTLSRIGAIGQPVWVLRPYERPNSDAGDLLIIHNTFPECLRQRIDPLEPSFFETRLLGFFGVISDTPDDTGHLGDFVHATSKPNGDDLFYGPGLSGSGGARHQEIVGDPYRDEEESGGETLSYVLCFPGLVCER